MNKVTKEQYEFALARVEELLPLVDDNTPANDKNAVELTVMSDIVIAYEKEHQPIKEHIVSKLIELSLKDKGMAQRLLASEKHIIFDDLTQQALIEMGKLYKELINKKEDYEDTDY